MARKPQEPAFPTAPETFASVLDQVGPRPDEKGGAAPKKNYAESLSNRIAVWLAAKLRAEGDFPKILPNPDGSGRETTVASGKSKKPKKTDVRFSTADTGLELLVSIKTYSFRDARKDKATNKVVLGRYTKNMVRNDHELRAEAMDIHERFPYAVLVGIMFMPFSACDDGKEDKSSFAHAVMTLRARGGRVEPSDPHQQFERMFIGLYEHDGARRGDIAFFDLMTPPPRRGRPRLGLVDDQALVREIVKSYGIRNRRYMDWADEAPDAPLLERDSAQEQDDDGDEPEG